METVTCPTCQADTPTEYNFCVACNSQVKCLNKECGKMLVPGKTFCFGCGQALTSSQATSKTSNKFLHTVQRGKSYSERTEFSVSDEAVSALAPFIVGRTVPSTRATIEIQNVRSPKIPAQALLDLDQNDMQNQTRILESDPRNAEPQNAQSPNPTSGSARYFVLDGENLVPNRKDYKGKTWADQQRNFILLYAAAYNQYFHKPVPVEAIKAAANKLEIADPANFSKYVGKGTALYFTALSQGVQLNPDGLVETDRILKTLEDEKVESGYVYWNRAATNATKKPRLSSDDKSRLHEWIKDEVDLGNLDITSVKMARDYAMLSIWIITVLLKKVPAIRWNDAHYYLKEKYSNVSASNEAFSSAVRRDVNKKFFRHTDDGKLFLEPEGQKKVASWVAGESKPSSEGEDK